MECLNIYAFEVSNRRRIQFLSDSWSEENPLCEFFLQLYVLMSNKEAVLYGEVDKDS